MNDDTDVLIAGAGLTGLTLAVDRARRGVPCRILDQAPQPAGGSKGKGLQPRTQEVFDDLGVAAPILAARAGGGHACSTCCGGRTSRCSPRTPRRASPEVRRCGRTCPRSRTEASGTP
ncbi:FAD-dependent monooxygenase [Nonomuraea gerenzanensis]|uniref:Putative monooxygenase n=1 Tax=Nonomuraea gerenzanensis TaxID=93944 RepID=A0A1M4EQU8_9ACTN|nr:FAD-dependent monooxygenase [Nonomuraea gerenzanensis]UBU12665.1 FAD-dependent monooxygenase [Nonomuraea gerenzanensis]SBP01222.1 putative monooxygenase [Nonomuraea gerenzanensis]